MACVCGHAEEEHAQGFLRACEVEMPDEDTVDGMCPCGDYEEDEES